MQPRRRPSTDVNNVGDAGLLRQVLTRNLMTVTFDMPELTEQPEHLSDESKSLKKREPCRQYHYNPGYSTKSYGSRADHLTSCSTLSMSLMSKPSSVSSRAFDEPAPCMCNSSGLKLNCGLRSTNDNLLTQQIDVSLPGASNTPSCVPSIDINGSTIDTGTANADNTDPGNEVGHYSNTYGLDGGNDPSNCSFSSVDGGLTTHSDSRSGYSSNKQACCVGCNCHSLPKYQKTEESSNKSPAWTVLNNTGYCETPKVCRSTPGSTAFLFPSPIPCPSTSDTSLWSPDYNTAGALCSTFSRLISSDGDAEETLPVPFSSIVRIKNAASSLSSPLDSSQDIMAPIQGLLSPLNRRNSIPQSPSLGEDIGSPENSDDISPLPGTCGNRFRRNSDMRTMTASGSDKFVTPKLIQRSDLMFGPVIGKGGFGRVHKGELHGLPVAIKVVQKRRGSGIHREILQAERLAFSLRLRHANIVHILGVNVCDDLRGEALIIMELVSSRTLQVLLDEDNAVISLDERLRFGIEVCSALRYLHGHQLVHLDVKPQNVLLGKQDRCKLADFGNLTRTRPGMPREDTDFTQLLGTLPYRAPELMKGQFPTCKADIYSLGITLWQMASRQMPHGGANPHWLIYQVTKNDTRPLCHNTGSDVTEIRYRALYQACWDARSGSRPGADEAQRVLIELREGAWQCGCDVVGAFGGNGRLG